MRQEWQVHAPGRDHPNRSPRTLPRRGMAPVAACGPLCRRKVAPPPRAPEPASQEMPRRKLKTWSESVGIRKTVAIRGTTAQAGATTRPTGRASGPRSERPRTRVASRLRQFPSGKSRQSAAVSECPTRYVRERVDACSDTRENNLTTRGRGFGYQPRIREAATSGTARCLREHLRLPSSRQVPPRVARHRRRSIRLPHANSLHSRHATPSVRHDNAFVGVKPNDPRLSTKLNVVILVPPPAPTSGPRIRVRSSGTSPTRRRHSRGSRQQVRRDWRPPTRFPCARSDGQLNGRLLRRDAESARAPSWCRWPPVRRSHAS